MWNSIKRISCYSIGFAIISLALPESISLKEFCCIVGGSCIIVLGTLLFHPAND